MTFDDDLRGRVQHEVRRASMTDDAPARDLQTVMRRGRRKTAIRRMVAASLVISVATGAVATARLIDLPEREERVTPADVVPKASSTERAAVFAIRAIAAAGMADLSVPGEYADYESIEAAEGGWMSTFTLVSCSAIQEDIGCEHPMEPTADNTIVLLVHERDGQLEVAGVEGPVDDEQRAALLAYREDASPEVPALEALSFEVIGEGDDRLLRGRALWTGPMPFFDGFVECTAQVLDGSGNVVNEEVQPRMAPAYGREDDDEEELGEKERDGYTIWPPLKIPPGVDDPQGRYLCETLAFSPKQGLPETHVEAAGGYELSDFGVQYLSPVDDPTKPELARIHYRVAWPDTGYPGIRRCTFTVHGADGETLGSKVEELDNIEPGHAFWLTEVDVDAVPHSVDVVCDPDRIDDATGRFVFTDFKLLRVSEPSDLSEGEEGPPDRIHVQATRRWEGGPIPATQSCVLKLIGAGGVVLREDRFTLSADSETRTDVQRHYVEGHEGWEEARLAETASIECVPFTGT